MQRVEGAHCQCDPFCRRKPLPHSPFCKAHQQRCWRKAPLSGAEPLYSPDGYNRFKGIKDSNNCYAYALDYDELPEKCTKEDCNAPFPQPGLASGYPKWSEVNGKRCPDVLARVLGDVPGSHMTNFTKKCRKGTRKVAFVVDPKEDYHVYRQDKNQYWSHKPGSTDVTNRDAMGRPIYDPQLAARSTSESKLKYTHFCGYVCVPTRRHRLKRSLGGRRMPQTRHLGGTHHLKRSTRKRSTKKKSTKTR